MKRMLAALAILAAVLIAVALYQYRDVLTLLRAFRQLQPAHAFSAEAPPAAPDYSLPQNWAAMPDRTDGADVVPDASVVDRQATANVDVFFVHPTTYYNPAHWNQPLGDRNADQFTDQFVLRNQASIFNSCCRVYAPRYRQATVYSFIDEGGDGSAALELAYSDIEQAFDYYLEHFSQGRPFILAGHSQGATHVRRLLERRVSGTPLVTRLVAAYPIGFAIHRADYERAAPDVPVCQSAEQIGCLATWSTVGPRVRQMQDFRNDICVNPLSWSTQGERADFSANQGAVTFTARFGTDVESLEADADFEPRVEPGVADAQCRDGLLWVSEIRSTRFGSRPMGRDNYHIYDLSLFHMNLRTNAELRAQRYMEMQAGAPVAGQ